MMLDANATSAYRRPTAGPSTDHAAQNRLRSSTYRGLLSVHCESDNGAIVLRGRVASFFLKQIAQEIVREADDKRLIVNELKVDDPHNEIAKRSRGTSDDADRA